MEAIVSSLLMFSGLFSMLGSGIETNFKRGLTLLIVGFLVFMVGYFTYPKPPSNTVVLKSNKVINTDSIYTKGYKDGIKDCQK